MLEAVFDDLKTDRLLLTRYDKINLAKYHHPSSAGFRQLSNFAARGYFLGIVCEQLAHNIFPGKKVKDADAEVKGKEPQDKMTLQQAMYAQGLDTYGVGVTPDNQLHRAGMEFNSQMNYHKQNQICKTLKLLADTCDQTYAVHAARARPSATLNSPAVARSSARDVLTRVAHKSCDHSPVCIVRQVYACARGCTSTGGHVRAPGDYVRGCKRRWLAVRGYQWLRLVVFELVD